MSSILESMTLSLSASVETLAEQIMAEPKQVKKRGRPRTSTTVRKAPKPKVELTEQEKLDELAKMKAMQEAAIAYHEVQQYAKLHGVRVPNGTLGKIINAAKAKHEVPPDTIIKPGTILKRVKCRNFDLEMKRGPVYYLVPAHW